MSGTDVVLVRPWDYDYEYIEWQEDLQIAYLSAFLESQGHSCVIIDLAVSQKRNDKELNTEWRSILDLKPTIVAFVMDKHPTNNPYYATKLIKHFNLMAQGSDWKPHVTVYGHTQIGTERFLRELPISSVITGEEADFTSLVKALNSKRTLSEVSGVAFIDSIGGFQRKPPLLLCLNLDELPFPTRYFLNVSNMKISRKCVAAMQASRGCYAKCSFCFLRAKEKLHRGYPWRTRAPESVAKEMEHLYLEFGVREFAFVDSQFFGPGNNGQIRAQRLSSEILKRGLEGIAFSIFARADSICPETIAKLKQAGLYAVFVGIESFNQSVLDRYNKGHQVADSFRAIQVLKDLGVRIRIGFISFDFFTTLEEIRQNISALKAICMEKAHLITQPLFFQNILAPLEDTPIAVEYQKIGSVVKWRPDKSPPFHSFYASKPL